MMQFDRNKLKAVVLTVLDRCPPDRVGAVKLHKVLYFFDMLSFSGRGAAAIGATYRKRPFGPTCEQLLPALDEMSRDGLIVISNVDYHGYRKTEYRALSAAPQIFDPDLNLLLIDVIDFVCMQNSASSISDYSHQAPWDAADFGAIIPYESAYLLLPMQVSARAFDRVAEGAQEIEDARSHEDAVDFGTFKALRDRVLSSLPQSTSRGH